MTRAKYQILFSSVSFLLDNRNVACQLNLSFLGDDVGVTAHHISRTNVNNSLETYETLLERDLMPLINQSLTIHPHQEIVWLRQSPTGADRFHREIDAETIIMYNTVIHRIFR